MKYTLAEARKKFIGKKFRIVHADRGLYMPYYIENVVGVCTNVISFTVGAPINMGDLKNLPKELIPKKRTFFKFRIESPDMYEKWFTAREIEPVE